MVSAYNIASVEIGKQVCYCSCINYKIFKARLNWFLHLKEMFWQQWLKRGHGVFRAWKPQRALRTPRVAMISDASWDTRLEGIYQPIQQRIIDAKYLLRVKSISSDTRMKKAIPCTCCWGVCVLDNGVQYLDVSDFLEQDAGQLARTLRGQGGIKPSFSDLLRNLGPKALFGPLDICRVTFTTFLFMFSYISIIGMLSAQQPLSSIRNAFCDFKGFVVIRHMLSVINFPEPLPLTVHISASQLQVVCHPQCKTTEPVVNSVIIACDSITIRSLPGGRCHVSCFEILIVILL